MASTNPANARPDDAALPKVSPDEDTFSAGFVRAVATIVEQMLDASRTATVYATGEKSPVTTMALPYQPTPDVTVVNATINVKHSARDRKQHFVEIRTSNDPSIITSRRRSLCDALLAEYGADRIVSAKVTGGILSFLISD